MTVERVGVGVCAGQAQIGLKDGRLSGDSVDRITRVFEAVVKQLQGDRAVSAIFRRLCHAWREARDRLLTILEPDGAPQDVRVWKRFGGVKTLQLDGTFTLVDGAGVSALASLVSLNSLSLRGSTTDYWEMDADVTDEVMKAISETSPTWI